MATENPAPETTDPAPVATEQPVRSETAPRRTVTLPVLPLAVIGAVIVALVFFGGGVALGVAIGDHGQRVGTVAPFGGQNGYGNQNGQHGFGAPNGQNGWGAPNGQHGFGPNRQNGQRGQNGQNGTGQHGPTNSPSGAPNNG